MGICSTAEIILKTVSTCRISLKSGNWLQGYSQKTIFNIAAVRHLEFIKKIIFGQVTVIEFQICCCVPNFIKIG